MHCRFLPRRTGRYLLAACLLAGCVPLAQGSGARSTAAQPLTMHIRNDRMTLQIAKAPQVYLAGRFDAQAVQQVSDWLRSWQIPHGADLYLDSSSGDIASGLALGKLFRAARLNTHLGAWRVSSLSNTTPARPATCLDACAYAWLGGVYRWSPTGADRIGVHASLLPDSRTAAAGAPTPQELRDYLNAMDVRPEYLAQVLKPAADDVVWWDADKMASWLVANNGRLPLQMSYQHAPADPPKLVLSQEIKGNRNEISLQCAPGKVSLTARYAVGAERAMRLAGRAMYAFFEVGQRVDDLRHGDRPTVDGDALIFTRDFPFAELPALLQTTSLGAWLEVTGTPVKLGFWLAPSVVQQRTVPFYDDCAAMQPGYVPPKAPAGQAKPSFWKRVFGHKQ